MQAIIFTIRIAVSIRQRLTLWLMHCSINAELPTIITSHGYSEEQTVEI
jgi:hypothetical protein